MSQIVSASHNIPLNGTSTFALFWLFLSNAFALNRLFLLKLFIFVHFQGCLKATPSQEEVRMY